MKKKIMSMIIAAASVLCLAACGNAKIEDIPDSPYEAVDYRLYPAPEGAYVGDTMPFAVDGGLELYYLYDTDHNGQGYHPVYKYFTKNMYEYEDKGLQINYGTPMDADLAIGTGSVMQDRDGLYHCFYTGHSDTAIGRGLDKECVMHATSTDREHWSKIPEDTFYSPENYSGDDFRDPNVFWVEEDQCYWLLIAARDNALGGIVAKYTSTDLKNWTLCDPIFAPMQQYMCECPDIFRMGDKWFLTYSWDCVTYYAVSDTMSGPYKAPADNVMDGTGFVFYAAKTGMIDDNRYLCAWVGRSAMNKDAGMYSWAGNMVNHQLVLKEEGRLGIREPETFAEYFTKDFEHPTAARMGKVRIKDGVITLNGEKETAMADFGTRPATCMIEADVTIDAAGYAGFSFGGSQNSPAWTALYFDAAAGLIHYEGTKIENVDNPQPTIYTRFNFEPGKTYHVKLVCENEIVIVYVDDTKALSNRIFQSIKGGHIGVFASSTNASFSNITMKVPEK